MPDSHKNFAYSTVATAPSPAASGTSLVVAAGQGALFPAVPFNATIWPTAAQPLSTTAEIVRVTAISTDTLTITRAQESSSARTVVVGDQIAATVTAKTLTDAEVGTSTIWDAAGDIAVGSGADTAAKLARGTPGQVLMPTATTLEWVSHPASGTGPSGSLTENFSRFRDITGVAGTSGTLRMVAIWLPKGLTITSIGAVCGSTAEAGGSHAWAALYDSARALLRQSTNETGAAAIAGSAAHTFTLTSTFVTTYAGLHYIGMNVVATTMPNILSVSAGNAALNGIAPVLAGNTSDTGLTTTAPSTAGTITAAASMFYCWVS